MGGFVQALRRRIVDALQRSLFDEEGAITPPALQPSTVAPAPTPVSPPAPPATPAATDPTRHPRATRSIVLDGRTVAYLLRRSRRRTIGFVVSGDGLVVSAPKWVTLRDIEIAVREKSRWIVARLAEQRERLARAEAARVVWADGSVVRYLGEPVVIALDGGHGIAAGEVALDGADHGIGQPRTLRVSLPRDAGEDRVCDAVQSWLQREARRVFEERAAHFAERLGVRVTRLSLSSAKTRWGSASADGGVRLNWRLVHHPLPTIDYVVAHELAHLREMNHGPRFWAVVRSVMPDYEAARQCLRDEAAAG